MKNKLLQIVKPLSLSLCCVAIVSCYAGYTTPSSYDVPPSATSQNSNVTQSKTLKPTVSFPARIAIVKLNGSMHQHFNSSKHKKTLSKLEGIAGIVNLNSVEPISSNSTTQQLQKTSKKYAADLLAVIRFQSSTHRANLSSAASVVTLGLAPTQTHRAASSVSLSVIDANTGYVYGVLDETVEKKGLSTWWGGSTTKRNTEYRAEKSAMDKLVKKMPALWESILIQHR